MSRSFNEDATNDAYLYTVAGGVAMNDALTLLMVCRIMAADSTWLSLLEGKSSGGFMTCAMGRHSSGNNIYFANETALIQGGNIQDDDGWMIVAITRSAAAATNAHKLPIGGSRTTTPLGALADNATLTMAGGTFRIAGSEDWANIRVAAAAFWNGTDLSNAQLDGILSAKTTQSIADLSPTWLVDDSDAFATNLVNPGTMDRASTTGAPADNADDPSGWVYGLGGGGGPSQRFMWMP